MALYCVLPSEQSLFAFHFAGTYSGCACGLFGGWGNRRSSPSSEAWPGKTIAFPRKSQNVTGETEA